MVGLTTALSSLVDSLNINQTRLSYVSDNIANVNTSGYTRKIVSQETKVSNGVALGVGLADARRSIDEFLLAASRKQASLVGEAKTKTDYLDRIQKFSLGNPSSPYTINNTVNELFSNLESFANDPSSAVKRSLTITAATNFTNTLTDLSNNIQAERLNADTELGNSISELNTALATLFDLNGAIRENSSSGGDILKLLDARDAELFKVKNLSEATVSFNEFGQASVILNNNEVLGYTQKYELSYTRLSSVDELVNNVGTNAIKVRAVLADGSLSSNSETIFSASDDPLNVNNIKGGKLKALIDLRDTDLPKILDQLDNIAYTVANEFNAVHNNGSGFPPPTSLTGTESFTLGDEFNFSGNFRITLTDANGRPLDDRYGNKLLPQVINLSEFDGGNGKGTTTVESLITEINSYFGQQPAQTVNVGAASDIRLASKSPSISVVKASGSVTFSGIPTNGNTIDINGTTFTFVTAASAANEVTIGSTISNTLTNLANKLNESSVSTVAEATYSATTTSLVISYDKAGTDGNAFTLDDSGTSVATASGTNLTGGTNATGDFEFDLDLSNLSTNGEDISFDISSISINGGATSAVTFDAATLIAGQRLRTDLSDTSNDYLATTLDSLNLQEGDSFTITLAVSVNENGVTKTENLTYTIQIPDPEENIKNQRYSITSIGTGGDGEILDSVSSNSFLTASLVNSNGTRVRDSETTGFLKLASSTSDIRITIDQMDSKENGIVGAADPEATATHRGFSHFFGLNNFFEYGAEKINSALNIVVRSDIKDSPQLLSGGRAERSAQIGNNASYTFEIGSGSNSTALDLVKIQDTNLNFASAGSLPELTTTLNAYATEIYNFAALEANNASSEYTKQTLLNESINSRIDDISGVNIDEELAATIQIQNAYTASARVISIVKELFDALNQTLQ